MDDISKINLLINLTIANVNTLIKLKVLCFYLFLFHCKNLEKLEKLDFIKLYNNIINGEKIIKDLNIHNDFYVLLISLDEAHHTYMKKLKQLDQLEERVDELIKIFDTKLTINIKEIQKRVKYDLEKTPILNKLVPLLEPIFDLINLEKFLDIK